MTGLMLPNGALVPVRDRRVVTDVEMRDPKAATRRVGFHSPTLPQVDEWDADQAFRFGYIANVVAYRCIQIRANTAASVPLVAGRRFGDPTTIREDAPIARLLGPPPGGPAPKLSARKLLRWTFAQEIVTGRRAWEIETHDGSPDGRPVAFWPISTAHLRVKPSKSGTEWFRLFEYGPRHDPVKLPPELVFYGWEPSGRDFRQADSALQAARFDLSLITLCDRYGIGFLRNNAVPAAIVTVAAFADDNKRLAFLRNWQAEYGGPDNAGRVALNEVGDDGDGPVGDSIDVKQLGLSARDARLVETRKEAMTEVAISLGVPWSKLDASGRTFDNAEIEDRTFWEDTVLPHLFDLQDDINMQLAPRLGSEVCWFDLRGVRALQRRITPVTQEVGAPALVQAQLMKINEARADYGLDPVDDGDRFMTVEEIQRLAPGSASLVLEPVTPPTPDVPQPPVQLPRPDEDDDDQDRQAAAENREADPEAIERRRARIWRAADAVVTALEARWERSWRRLFARQADATVARLRGKRGRQALGYGTDGQPDETRAEPSPEVDPAAIFDLDFWRNQTLETVQDLYEEVTVAGLTRLAVVFGVAFDVAAPWVREFIEARANQLAGPVTQTTYDAIRAELVEGVAAGESIDDLAARIRNVFTQATDVRARTIARTEVISAYNGSAALGATQLPADVAAGQEWIATRDSRTRETHAAVDGQVVAVGTPFIVGGHQAAYPGDPALPAKETVNCRCSVAFLTPEEFAEFQGRARRRVDLRAAAAMLRLVTQDTDLLAWRRALEEVAA